jgi:hypothetical protein
VVWLGSLPLQAGAQATQIKPRFLIVIDTSGSMDDPVTPGPSCAGYPATKLGHAKCAIKNILNSIGDAEFGLMQFAQSNAAQTNCGGSTCDQTANSGVLLQGIASNNTATLLTYVNNDNTNPELCAADGTPLGGVLATARGYFLGGTSPTANDTAAACRPLNVILLTDGAECCGGCQNGGCPNAAADVLSYLGSANQLRQADGTTPGCQVTCTTVPACTSNHSETAPERAYELYNTTNVPTPSGPLLKRIKTYPIGFGVAPGDVRMENIAKAGHTNAPGQYYSNYASDEATLSAALNQIILDSQLTEVCNGIDDDCDLRVDEGYPKYCDINHLRSSNGGQTNVPAVGTPVPGVPGNALCAQPEWTSSSTCVPPNLLCADPGEICNQVDDDCDGKVDENAPATNVPDTCDLIDNDCDQKIDEDCNPNQCTPEICDNLDNNCNGQIDENLTRQCGTDTGACTAGQQTCQAGQWGAINPATSTWQLGFCTGEVAPVPETCNNIDDNCDGVIDQITRPCAPYGVTLECLAGVETCVAGVWQSTDPNPDNVAACIGARGPSTELCDGKDNDCMPSTPDGSADSRVGKTCGNAKGICIPGTTVCTAGNVVCNDPSEATAEICDGLDNDCDGKIDEGTPPLPGVGDPCFPNLPDPPAVVGECRAGMKACVGGTLVCQNFKGPTPDICDTLDNDCNAQTADGSADPAVGQICGSSVGECRQGSNICTGGQIICSGGRGPVAESCDGKDNDCDNVTDENLPDTNNDDVRDIVSCGSSVGLCRTGEELCVAVPTSVDPDGFDYQCIGGVGPVPEICDGLDNNCNGVTDECTGDPSSAAFMACVNDPLGPLGAGGGQICGNPVAPCHTGKTKCVADADGQGHPGFVCVGNLDGGPEICNLQDDDCDTKIDEDLDPANDPRLGQVCGQGMAGTCRDLSGNPCGKCRFGVQQCVMGVIECIGTIGPSPYEKCNKADDDCDGKIDECVDPNDATCPPGEIDPNTPVGSLCGDGTGECMEGINVCVDGALVCQGVVGPTDEICNGKDDDCDTLIDENIPVGAPCGSSVGECQPGVLVCPPGGAGALDCQGGVLPMDETCDGLDNDCDGMVDEGLGLGELCGSDVGQCKQGKVACVGGRKVCGGEAGPQLETCDCLDNDCDGKIDEDSAASPVCPGGSACVMCQCALGCAPTAEFAAQCPQGKAAVVDDKGCFCVGEQCKQSDCQSQTIKVNDEIQCAPKSDLVGSCFCKNNGCTFRCSGVECTQGLICDPTDGRCKQKSCLLPQFPCSQATRCSLLDNEWQCVEDPCASSNCDKEQVCRDGKCYDSCAKVECSATSQCKDGTCSANRCAGVTCDSDLVCNPDDGQCTPAGACASAGCPDGQTCDKVSGACAEDVCLSTRCPYGQQCNSDTGQCELRCFGNLLFCDTECVNPATSRTHCGASADCQGQNAGEECDKGLVCSLGKCSATCGNNLLNCGGECIDPHTEMRYCGAKTDCKGANAGEVCAVGFNCVNSTCRSISGTGSTKLPDGKRVVASGGGGCACSVAVGGHEPGPASSRRGPLSVLLLMLGVALLGRRRLGRRISPLPARAWLMLALCLAASGLGSGCKVDTFCLDCPSAKKNSAKIDGGSGIVGGRVDSGASGVDSGKVGRPDAMPATPDAGSDSGTKKPDGGCMAIELCNGIDDDCDGKIDEDADPAALNIDVKTDVNNCGGCGQACAIPHAFNKCAAGTCGIDTTKGDQGCDVGFHNLDGNDGNGCEYRCVKSADDDSVCDLVDNNCNGQIDENVDLNTDPNNCGSCSFRCSYNHAANGGTCVDKVCALDDTKCDDGYANVDMKAPNGCEYHCPVWPKVDEICNGLDDDCDGMTDEDVSTATDSRIGIACGSAVGSCMPGVVTCVSGAPTCVGGTGPQREVCDGLDNDCDGETDTDDPDIGLPCGDAYPGSQCSKGTLQIPGGGCHGGVVQDLVCVGAQGPVPEICNGLDDDCDGQADEAENGVKPQEGQQCINGANGMQIVTTNPPQWTAATLCKTGGTVCESGNLVCRNEVSPDPVELCDDKDQDCDGDPLNGFTPDVPNGTTATTGPDPRVGKSCGIDTGECVFGVQTCHLNTHTVTCDNQVLPTAEICDGKDNDCDGRIDETDSVTGVKPVGAGLPCIFDSSGVLQYGSSVAATSPCVAGTTTCVAGHVACPNYVGPTAELCDGVDQDCDGILKEASFPADTRINASCDTDNNTTGICNSGTQYCDTTGAIPTIRCQGEVFPATELCDGLDNDCNAATADGAAETWLNHPCSTNSDGSVNLAPTTPLGICRLGTAVCLGGIQQCVNEIGPQLETCDVQAPADLTNPAYDQNCNGVVDEDFQLQNNTARCGTCSNNCATAQPNANMICTAGVCQIASCKVGYYDDKRTPAADCSLHDGVNCTFGGVEVCDGADNDCDGLVDESTSAEPIALPAASQFCIQQGACAGSAVVCRTYKKGPPIDVTNTNCTGYSDPTCQTSPVCTIRPAAFESCDAPYNQESNPAYDNNCDGVSDSVFFHLNDPCSDPAAKGACATVGNKACNLTTMTPGDTFCADASGNPVVNGTPGALGEAVAGCNNIDDDCDGKTDEACGVAGTTGTCVTDAWVPIPNTTSFIYPYEASRIDATNVGSGTNSTRACSVVGHLPWGNLTWNQAEAACEATDPQGRLCTEDEWQAACEVVDGTSNLCAWSFASNCNTWVADTCNGLDFVGTQEPEPTGWTGAPAMSSTCSRPHSTFNVFDMSGNVKEYTDLRANGTIPVRGGADNNAQDGLRCDFNFTVWPDQNVSKFPNVGFRCCRGPRWRCQTYNSTDTPISSASGADITSTITVSSSGIASVTQVAATLRSGNNTPDINDLNLNLTHGATTRSMVNLAACNNNTNLTYNITFDSKSATLPTVSGGCGFLTGGGSFAPAQAFSAFNGAAADGTWVFFQNDTDAGDTNVLSSWTLRVCGN